MNTTSLKTNHQAWLIGAVIAIYTALIFVWACFHEPWRDEVAALTLGIQSHSLWDLLGEIRSYGHPSLWFLILYGAYHIFPSYSILKIINLFVSVLAAYVLLKKAPFSWGQKMLFLLGYFPFYCFPVVNRSYGLCLLLFLLFCSFYPRRWQNILPLGVVLFLLANAHAAGLVITVVIFLTLGAELLFSRGAEALKQNSFKKIFSGLMIIAVGIVLSTWQIHPDSSSIVFSWGSLNLQKILDALQQAVFLPGKTFRHVLGGEHTKVVTLFIAGSYFLLRKQPFSLSIMVLGTIGLSLFFQLIYPHYSLYHESFVYMLMIFAFWMTANAPKAAFPIRDLFFTAILLSQVVMAYPAIQADLRSDFSSSKRFAQWIGLQPQGEEYVLVGEPDYLLESLPYYVSNDIYIPREGQFGKVTHFTLTNQRVFSLEGFLRTAGDLKAQGKDALLVLGHHLKKDGPFEIHFSYDKIFQYSSESLALWETKTRQVASFHGALHENYDVFVLK